MTSLNKFFQNTIIDINNNALDEILEHSIHCYEREKKRFEILTNKASIIFGFLSATLAIIISLLLSKDFREANLSKSTFLIFIFIIILLFASIIALIVGAIRPQKVLEPSGNNYIFVQNNAKKHRLELVKELLDSYALSTRDNKKKNDSIAQCINSVIVVMTIALIFFLFYAITF